MPSWHVGRGIEGLSEIPKLPSGLPTPALTPRRTLTRRAPGRLLDIGLDLSAGPDTESPIEAARAHAGGAELKQQLRGSAADRRDALLAILAGQVADYAVLSQVVLARLNIEAGVDDLGPALERWLPIKEKLDRHLLKVAEALSRLESPLRVSLTADHVNLAHLQQVIEREKSFDHAPTNPEDCNVE